MKTIFVSLLILSISLSAQKTDTIPYLRVEDPTQIFSSVGIDEVLFFEAQKSDQNASTYDNFFGGFNLNGTVALGNVRFSALFPFTTRGNETTLLGDIQMEFGVSFPTNGKTYTSTQLYGGLRLPTGIMDEETKYDALTYQGTFGFHLGSVSALALNEKWYLYPLLEFFVKQVPMQLGQYDDPMCSLPPDIKEIGLRIGTAASYRLNKRSFIKMNLLYENGHRNFEQTCFNGVESFTEISSNLYFNIRQQLSLKYHNFIYFQMGLNFLNLLNQPEINKVAPVNQFVLIFGYQYALGSR